jgi:hypothetical protein
MLRGSSHPGPTDFPQCPRNSGPIGGAGWANELATHHWGRSSGRRGGTADHRRAERCRVDRGRHAGGLGTPVLRGPTLPRQRGDAPSLPSGFQRPLRGPARLRRRDVPAARTPSRQAHGHRHPSGHRGTPGGISYRIAGYGAPVPCATTDAGDEVEPSYAFVFSRQRTIHCHR